MSNHPNPGLSAIVADAAKRKQGKRSGNKNRAQAPAGQAFTFLPDEYTILKFNMPGPSGLLGGYQKMENTVVESTNKTTLTCVLGPVHFERLVRYIKNYGSGGPNGRLRRACIPALRRAGV